MFQDCHLKKRMKYTIQGLFLVCLMFKKSVWLLSSFLVSDNIRLYVSKLFTWYASNVDKPTSFFFGRKIIHAVLDLFLVDKQKIKYSTLVIAL